MYAVGGTVNLGSHDGKHYGSSYKKKKKNDHMIQQFYSRKMKMLPQKDTCASKFIAALFTIAKL